MNLLLFLISLVFPCISGLATVGHAGLFRVTKHAGLLLTVSLFTGLGLSSFTLFAWLIVFGRASSLYIAFEFLLLIFSAFMLRRKWHEISAADCNAASSQTDNRYRPGHTRILTQRRIKYIFTFLLLLQSIYLLSGVVKLPIGYWDAWAIWNLRAKMIFLSGDAWENAFSEVYRESHPDYPLLLPLAITRSWIFTGEPTSIVPAAFSIFAALATVIFLFYALERLRSSYSALTAALIVTGTPFFLKFGCWQYSDQLLGLLMLFTGFCFVISAQEKSEKMLFLAGLHAGFAAWLKNEGLVFAMLSCVYIVTSFFFQATRPSFELFKKKLIIFGAGIAPGLIALIIFKLMFPGKNDILSAISPSTLTSLLEPERYQLIFEHISASLFSPSPYNLFKDYLPLPLLMIFYLFINGKRNSLPSANLLVILPSGMFMSYFTAYLISPHDLAWHLQNSFNRLCMQQWPIIVFLFSILAAGPHAENNDCT